MGRAAVIVAGLLANGAGAGLKETRADDGEEPAPLSGDAMRCKQCRGSGRVLGRVCEGEECV